jgi:rhodanese-related sulfurtransferase
MKVVKHLLFIPLLALIVAGCAEPPPYTNLDNDELKTLMAQGVPLYDIRRAEEWRSTGVIKGSRRLTFFDGNGNVMPDFMPRFTRRIGKNDPVIFICRTGNRTDAMARYLVEKLGYTKVYNVQHGITKWISEERPVSRF